MKNGEIEISSNYCTNSATSSYMLTMFRMDEEMSTFKWEGIGYSGGSETLGVWLHIAAALVSARGGETTLLFEVFSTMLLA